MQPATFVLLSGVLTFGVPFVLAVRELVMLRRHRDGPGPGRDRRPDDRPPPPRPGGGVVRPLPACLIEAARLPPARTRTRQLEDA